MIASLPCRQCSSHGVAGLRGCPLPLWLAVIGAGLGEVPGATVINAKILALVAVRLYLSQGAASVGAEVHHGWLVGGGGGRIVVRSGPGGRALGVVMLVGVCVQEVPFAGVDVLEQLCQVEQDGGAGVVDEGLAERQLKTSLKVGHLWHVILHGLGGPVLELCLIGPTVLIPLGQGSEVASAVATGLGSPRTFSKIFMTASGTSNWRR